MSSPTTAPHQRRRRKPKRRPSPVEHTAQLEVWALLCNTDVESWVVARSMLERQSRTGLRHFSAIQRAVPLGEVPAVQQLIREMDHEADLDDAVAQHLHSR